MMTIIVKVLVLIFCLIILFALGSALYFLVSGKGNPDRIVKALSWRIGISFLLFILLFIAFAMGWITPHSL